MEFFAKQASERAFALDSGTVGECTVVLSCAQLCSVVLSCAQLCAVVRSSMASKHGQGVKLRLGQPFVPELVSEGAAACVRHHTVKRRRVCSGCPGEVVLWCVGTKPRASELFVDRSALSLQPPESLESLKGNTV